MDISIDTIKIQNISIVTKIFNVFLIISDISGLGSRSLTDTSLLLRIIKLTKHFYSILEFISHIQSFYFILSNNSPVNVTSVYHFFTSEVQKHH